MKNTGSGPINAVKGPGPVIPARASGGFKSQAIAKPKGQPKGNSAGFRSVAARGMMR